MEKFYGTNDTMVAVRSIAANIVIDAKNKTVELAGKKLGRRTLAELVKADGFSTKNDFFTYFEKSSENGIFDGVLIKW